MSYILDALRRSEEERNRGHVPTLKTVYHDYDNRNLEFLHSNIGRALILALVVAVGALLYSNRQSLGSTMNRLFADETVPAKATAQPQTVATATQAEQQLTVVQGQAQQKGAATARPASDSAGTAAPQAESQPVQAAPPQPAAVGQIAGATNSQATRQSSVAGEQHTTAASATGAVNQPQTVATAQPAAASANRASNALKTKHDLPPDIMRSVPKLAISVVSYSKDPDERFVMVNSELFYEGEEITENLIIEAITSDGPVVSWRGYEFLLKP